LKKKVLVFGFSIFVSTLMAQTEDGYNPTYKPLYSGNIVMDKDFYLFTAILESFEVRAKLSGNDSLIGWLQEQTALVKMKSTDTSRTAEALLGDFRWSSKDSMRVDEIFRRQYKLNRAVFDKLIDGHLRPSGYYQRFVGYDNEDLLLHAWGQCVVGINYIIDQYGLGKKMRYPTIDSISYDVTSEYYRELLKVMFSYLTEKTDSMQLFFQPRLALALELLRANDRDEPARYEPLEKGENRAAVEWAKNIKWNLYPYGAIVVPGEGPELYTVSFDPMGRMRCDLAAQRWRKKLAPFIVVSGGYCHPFHTPFCEAIEMKKYLVGQCGIPESAVIIDPQARHTTTNFRNAGRLIIRYRIPMEKPALCITTKDQADYIENPGFGRRCQRELGYVPYRDLERLSQHEIRFYIVPQCLHMDPYDPLDP
jgi:DUF218 domain